jgi:hypothetical protein
MGMLDEVHCNHELFNHQFFGVQKPSTLAIHNESSGRSSEAFYLQKQKAPQNWPKTASWLCNPQTARLSKSLIRA